MCNHGLAKGTPVSGPATPRGRGGSPSDLRWPVRPCRRAIVSALVLAAALSGSCLHAALFSAPTKWQTYQDITRLFSIRHPEGWVVRQQAHPEGFEIAFTPLRDAAIAMEDLTTAAKVAVSFSPAGIPDAYLKPETVFARQRLIYEAINRKYQLTFTGQDTLLLPGVPGQTVVRGHFNAQYGGTAVLEDYFRIPRPRWEISLVCDYPRGDTAAKALMEEIQRSFVLHPSPCGWLAPAAPAPADTAAIVKQARQCTVLILVKNAQGERVAAGSGFLVHPAGYILSNAHVVKPEESGEGDEEKAFSYEIHWDSREGRAPVPARYVAHVRSQYHSLDFGLLKVDGINWPYLATEPAASLDNLSEIISPSFPKPDLTQDSFDITIQKGVVNRINHDARGRVASFLSDLHYDHGSSGSPCLSARSGRVVGVNSFVRRGQLALFGGVLPIDAAYEHFEALRYPPNGTASLTALDHYKLGALFWGLGQHATAERTLGLVCLLDENNDHAWHLRGLVWFDAGDFLQATAHFETALRIDPASASTLASLAGLQLAEPQLDYPRCTALLDRLISAAPHDSGGFRLRGELLRRNRQFDAALTNLQHAIGLAHDLFPQPHVELAQLYSQRQASGDTNLALQAVEKALRIDPLDTDALQVLADLHADRPEAGLERFTRLATAHPEQPTAQ